MRNLLKYGIALAALIFLVATVAPQLQSRTDGKKRLTTAPVAKQELVKRLPSQVQAKHLLKSGKKNKIASEVYSTDFEGEAGEWTAFNLNGDGSGNVFTWVDDNSNSPTHSWFVAEDNALSAETAVPTNTRLVSPQITLPSEVDGQEVSNIFVSYAFDVYTPNTADGGFVYDVWEALIEVPFAGDNLWHTSTVDAFAGASWFCGQDATGTYTDNTRQELRTPVLDLSAAAGAVMLNFKNFDSIEDDFDYGYLEVSSDGGDSWITLDVYSEEKSAVAYTDASYDISAYATTQTVVRWRFESDGGYQSPFGWHIDNVEVTDGTTTFLFDDGGDTAIQLLAVNNPLAFQRLHYDYDQGGSTTPNWAIEDNDVIFNGSLNVVAYAGMTVRFALNVSTDGWHRLGITDGRGFYFDDFSIVAEAGLNNDVSVSDLDVPFPNVASFASQSALAQISNTGLNDQSTVIFRHRVNDGPVTLSLPQVSVNSGATVPKPFEWAAASGPGDYKLTGLTTLGQDEDRSNDTLSVAPVTVFPDGLAELGYDDRFLQDQFVTASTCLVSFTVLSDLRGTTDSYNLHRVKVDLFNASGTSPDQLRIVVATASDDTTLVDVLLDVVETLPPGDFSSHFFDVNANGLTSPRFVVLVDFSVSAGNARVIMDAGTRFTGHNFFFNGARWGGSGFGRQIRAWISWLAAPDIISVRDVPNDQGKQAHVLWFPSPNESFSSDISHYVLWRAVKGFGAVSPDPNYNIVTVPSIDDLYKFGSKSGKNGDRVVVANSGAWDYIASVPSHPGFDAYGYVAPTLADSNAAGRNYTTFMVSAYDVSGNFVDSEVDSGYSVDNIAPTAPANFVASNPATGVQLRWRANEEEDLAYYTIYKGTNTTPLVTTTDLNYLDLDVSEGVTYNYRITAFDVNGNESASSPASVVVGVADRPTSALPTEYGLGNNYPNPFNPQTSITFALPENGRVVITILNSLGQEIEKLVDGNMPAGFHTVVWDAKKHTSGVYFYRLTVNNFTQMKKMVLMK